MTRYLYSLLFLTAFIFNPFLGSAQVFKSGFIAGLNTTQLLGGVSSGFRQFGISAGSFVQHDLDEKSGVKMEILFSQKGERKPIRPNIGDYDFFVLRLNYIEVPFLFLQQHHNFKFEIGPSFNYLAGYITKNNYGELPVGHPLNRPFRKMEFSGNVGINYELSENLDMNWRFSNSLIPVRKHLGGSVFWFNRGQYNSAISFRIIYWFNRNYENSGG